MDRVPDVKSHRRTADMPKRPAHDRVSDPTPGTPTPALPAEDGIDRKTRQILDAAGRAFREHGYGKASVDRIARDAGVSKATLYTRFPSKDAMFMAVVDRERRRRHLDDVLTDDSRSLEDRLRAWGENIVTVIVDPFTANVYRMVVAESPRFPEVGRAFYRSAPQVAREQLARALAEHGAAAGLAIDDPHRAAGDLIGLLRGDLHLRALDVEHRPGTAEIRAAVEHAVDVFLRAYRT